MCFVPLQPLTVPDLIVSAIADALHFQFYGQTDPKEQLLSYLRAQPLLLVLDNCEHLLDGIGVVSDILAAAPGVNVLATSRETLNLREEWVYPVKGMRFPQGELAQPLEDYSAAQLFTQSARRARPDFSPDDQQALLVRICQLVEGMPLGIELAAAWLKRLPLAEIVRELERSLDILESPARNIPSRHRSMRAVFDHSWNLLTETERAVFMKLSVFRGGFTREAAEPVADASLKTLSALVDKSLLRISEDGRYDLHELLRQYCAERLDESSEEAEPTRDRHCSYYVRFMERQWPRLTGSEIKAALQDIRTELDNVRAAWDWAVSQRKAAEVEAAIRSLWFFYGVGVRYQEGVQVFANAAPAFRNDAAVYGKLLARWGELSFVAGSTSNAKRLLEESLALLRQVQAREEIAFVLYRLAWVIIGFDPDLPKVTEYLEESLAIHTELDDRFGVGEVLLGWGRFHRHRYIRHGLDEALQRAQQCFQESLVAFQQQGSSFGIACAHLMGLSSVADLLGDHHRSWQYAQTSLEFFQELGIGWGITWSLGSMANAACGLGAYAEARRCALDSLLFGFKVGWPNPGQWILPNVHLAAAILMGEGEKERAYELLGVVAQQRHRFDIREDDTSLFLLRLLDEELPPNLADAVARGRERDLDVIVKEVLADLSSVESAASLPSLPSQVLVEPLSGRELEILRLIADGLNSREVAERLFLSVGTIRWYLKHIYGKLDAHSRSEAIARARELKLLA